MLKSSSTRTLSLVRVLHLMFSTARAGSSARFPADHIMVGADGAPWNGEAINFNVAAGQLGWNLPMDVVGAGVYGGIAKRDEGTGALILGDEWPENNGDWSQGPHCRVAPNQGVKSSPFLDFTRYTRRNRGYTEISGLITRGDASGLEDLFEKLGGRVGDTQRKKLANLVMVGGARPLHMAGMTRGGDPGKVVEILLAEGADSNSLDGYAMTPLDRMESNRVAVGALMAGGGTARGSVKTQDVPDWRSEEFWYTGGVGESESHGDTGRDL